LYVSQAPALPYSHLLTYKQTAPTMAAKYLELTAPQALCEALDEYGDLLNTPSIGNSVQHYFSNVQVNISPAATSKTDCEYSTCEQAFADIDF